MVLTPTPPALKSAAGIFQRREKIFLALALEFFLGGLEVGDARGDFFAFLREAVLQFGHAHPFFDSCPASIGVSDWGANWETALQDCGARLAVDKTIAVLVAYAPSR
jgi:hypothetical protein